MSENVRDQPGLLSLHDQPPQQSWCRRGAAFNGQPVTPGRRLLVVGSNYCALLAPWSEGDPDIASVLEAQGRIRAAIGSDDGLACAHRTDHVGVRTLEIKEHDIDHPAGSEPFPGHNEDALRPSDAGGARQETALGVRVWPTVSGLFVTPARVVGLNAPARLNPVTSRMT